MIRSYSLSTNLISISDGYRENKMASLWLLHKHYPFVPTRMQNVTLKLPVFLVSHYPGNCIVLVSH